MMDLEDVFHIVVIATGLIVGTIMVIGICVNSFGGGL